MADPIVEELKQWTSCDVNQSIIQVKMQASNILLRLPTAYQSYRIPMEVIWMV